MLYAAKPRDFNSLFDVSGVIVSHADSLLLLLRHPDKPEGKTWCLPGGKANPGEGSIDTGLRETFEETKIRLRDGQAKHHRTYYVRYPEKDFTYHVLHASLDSRPRVILNPLEHIESRWVLPSTAVKMHLIPDEEPCLREFYNLTG